MKEKGVSVLMDAADNTFYEIDNANLAGIAKKSTRLPEPVRRGDIVVYPIDDTARKLLDLLP
jgi:hypothetical protein